MSNKNKYWKGVEELNDSSEFKAAKHKEFNEYLPVEEFIADGEVLESSKTNRRDFLKYLGFGITAASLAACETPVHKAIPYVVKPEKINAGVASWFASTFDDGYDYCSILVKTREGRPIKIEGNKLSEVTKGAVNARVNSSVLSLYDGQRYKAPMSAGAETTWSKFDKSLKKELQDIVSKGGKIRILSSTINSPSTLKLINEFIESLSGADVKHIVYDTASFSASLEAHQSAFGKKALPSYDFSKAKTIVSIGADFLVNFPSSIEYSKQYGISRNPEKGWMSKHFQFESVHSLTGSNADVRTPIKPSEHAQVVAALHSMISGGSGVKSPYVAKLEMAAKELKKNAGSSIVVSNSNDKNVQQLVLAINQSLGNYGKTMDIENESYLRKGLDSDIIDLSKEMNSGSVDALLVMNLDPIYSLPASLQFKEGFEKVATTVSFAYRPNKTSVASKYVAASHHYLESWNDHNPRRGQYSLSQPVITPLFDTRQPQDVLLKLMDNKQDFYTYLQENWKSVSSSRQANYLNFDDFWNHSLQDGVLSSGGASLFASSGSTPESTASSSYNDNSSEALRNIASPESSDWELEFYYKVGIGDGNQAYNPWLQELPDPITKLTWDNYVTINPQDARDLGFSTEYGEQKDANTINLNVNGLLMEAVPVIAVPGQARKTLGIALGYGQNLGKENRMIGINAYPMLSVKNGNIYNYAEAVSFEENSEKYPVASTQTHYTIMGRDSIIRETAFGVFETADKEVYNPAHILATHEGPKNINDVDLWADPENSLEGAGHRWGMSIDLSTCIGCGSCVTSCTSENNVPVVGKDEVRRSREMHWIRIDRYFSSVEGEDVSYAEMEVPEDNPRVVHQPMMCQHCNHAPCETVCPVAATTHSSEGLNQMTYNRCIGTRYCANNCPYKVRRFNWFNYVAYDKFNNVNPAQDDLGRMVLNPDVTVRARGVMEKCSMCVQRIQVGKLDAKKEGRKVMDGDIETACASACPTNAIIFGDINDESTKVHQLSNGKRAYRVIEEVGTKPNIYYQVKVRNLESNQV